MHGRGALADAIAGAAHPLIALAPVTSIPESPLIGYLVFAPEYADFRLADFRTFVAALRTVVAALPKATLQEAFAIRALFPLVHLDVGDARLAADVYAAPELAPFSLIAIDAEPTVVRLFPTPTNHDVVDALGKALRRLTTTARPGAAHAADGES
mmetsp:Transcript_22479/g.89247  ORF Transcript_22479/g.89247 Transcript_22479/m.89247 type:complete len:155 (+) Transcript_22479:488-952(+)